MTMPAEHYLEKAAATLAQLAEAKTDAERMRLKRAHGVYLKLASHGAEAAARAAMAAPARVHAARKSTPARERAQS